MALVSSYDGFIFDYGGVLVHHQTEEDQAEMARIAQIPRDLFFELYWSQRQEYDKDELTYADYWLSLAHRAGAAFRADVIEKLVELDTASWMHFDPVMWEWVDQLRQAGKRAAILSNMPRELGEALKSRTNRLDSFDQVTLSYQVRAAKPEAAAYEHCLEGLDVPAERTLFLDDRIENVQAAEVLGIHAMQFTSRDDVLLLLRS